LAILIYDKIGGLATCLVYLSEMGSKRVALLPRSGLLDNVFKCELVKEDGTIDGLEYLMKKRNKTLE